MQLVIKVKELTLLSQLTVGVTGSHGVGKAGRAKRAAGRARVIVVLRLYTSMQKDYKQNLGRPQKRNKISIPMLVTNSF